MNPLRIRTEQERRILADYGAGKPVDEICDSYGLTRQEVTEPITRIARYDRRIAEQLVAEFDAGKSAASTRDPAPAGGGTEALLAQADRHGTARARKLAARIRVQITELDAVMRAAAAELRLQTEIEQLRRQLTGKQAQLRDLRKPAGPTTSAATSAAAPATSTSAPGPSARQVREWAREQGIECNAHGRVPDQVMSAYVEAHPS